MAVIQGRTRKQIRVAVGYNLGALYVSSTTSEVDTSSIVDTSLRGGDDAHNGKWVVLTSGSNDEAIRQVSDYTQSSTDMTVTPAFSASVASTVTYELWDERFNPARIHDYINQGILDVTGRAYDPVEDTSLFADGSTARFDLPSTISMIRRVDYRYSVTSATVHDCESDFDEVATPTGISTELDTQDKKQGNQSLKVTYVVGAGVGAVITDSIASKDLSKYTHLEFWIKINLAAGTSSGNLKLLLDDTANCSSPLETLSVPALTADTWKYCQVALANPESDTAIISVGLEYDLDLGACVVWLDDIKAVTKDTATWNRLENHLWGIDRAAQDLVFTNEGRSAAGYHMLKITGGDKPALLNADDTACEVYDWYLIARATALALSVDWGAPDPGEKRRQATYWMSLAEEARRRLPMLQNLRTVS